jgi:hypothetical protein
VPVESLASQRENISPPWRARESVQTVLNMHVESPETISPPAQREIVSSLVGSISAQTRRLSAIALAAIAASSKGIVESAIS